MLNTENLIKYFNDSGLELDTVTAEKLCGYADMLIEKNKVMNLTAITDDEGVAIKHFVDSILPLTMVDFPQNASLIDVGAGAGFPSVPMCIYRPDLTPTMLDATNKRVEFLKEVCEKYIKNADCVHKRAEEYKDKRESFDIATARAVARLNVLSEYCLPFVKVGGMFVALKGKDGADEVADSKKAVEILGGKIEKVISYSLSNGDERTLVVIRKTKPTPPKYPRPSAKISKLPL